jgi:hypothetical protein
VQKATFWSVKDGLLQSRWISVGYVVQAGRIPVEYLQPFA